MRLPRKKQNVAFFHYTSFSDWLIIISLDINSFPSPTDDLSSSVIDAFFQLTFVHLHGAPTVHSFWQQLNAMRENGVSSVISCWQTLSVLFLAFTVQLQVKFPNSTFFPLIVVQLDSFIGSAAGYWKVQSPRHWALVRAICPISAVRSRLYAGH